MVVMNRHAAPVYDASWSSLRLLSTLEVAQLLGCSRRTVERMAARGQLNPVHIGPRLVRFSWVDVAHLAAPQNAERPATTPDALAETAASPAHDTA
jgi:excisionase family DNA binding protein